MLGQLVGATLAALTGLVCSAAAAEKMNLLVLISDDMRPNLGAYQQEYMKTPNIDKLAAGGLVFERAYTNFAVCAPSRNSFMSGRRPDTSKVWNFVNDFRQAEGADKWNSWPEYFKKNGYTALGLGKTYHVGHPPNFDEPKSWSQSQPYLNYWLEKCPHGGAGGGMCVINDEEKIFDYVLANKTIETLRNVSQDPSTPFAIFSGFKKPHAPWGVPQRFYDLYPVEAVNVTLNPHAPVNMPPVAFIHDFSVRLMNGTEFSWSPTQAVPDWVAQVNRQAYYAAISYVDEQVGKILGELDRLNLSDNTIVVFMADHGYMLGDHGEWEKKNNFELGTRVPLIIRDPSKAKTSAGRRTRELTTLVDLYPTTAVLAGLPFPEEVRGEGQSVAHVFNNPAQMRSNASFSQYPRCGKLAPTWADNCNNVDRTDFHFMGYTVRSNDYRYTVWLKWNGATLTVDWNDPSAIEGRELYDHRGDNGADFDAFEKENVVDQSQFSSVVAQLHAALRAQFDHQ